jgi:hypothetical protein
MIDPIEVFLNEQRADLQVFRVTLTVFLIRLLGTNPATAEARLSDLKGAVLGALSRTEVDPSEELEDRMKQMTIMRGEKFFVELEELIGATLDKMSPSARN